MAWRGSGVRIPQLHQSQRPVPISGPALFDLPAAANGSNGQASHLRQAKRRGDCRHSAHHKICSGHWRRVVSLGSAADGKRLRKKVSGQTRTEVKDKLRALDAGVRAVQGYTAGAAVADWLAEDLPGRAAKTVEVYREALRRIHRSPSRPGCSTTTPTPTTRSPRRPGSTGRPDEPRPLRPGRLLRR